jgi:hypothetical protein
MSESEIIGGETGGESREARLWPGLALLWVLACGITQVSLPFYETAQLSRGGWMSSVWIGTMWAGWAAGVWASSVWGVSRISRLLFLALLGSWHFLWMSTVSGEPPVRYAMMLGGYGLAQAILFRMLSIPRWGMDRATGKNEAVAEDDFLDGGDEAALAEPFGGPSSGLPVGQVSGGERLESGLASAGPQFGIAELIGITTVVALLITVGKAYRPFIGNSFWWGLLLAEAMLLVVAALSVMAGLSRQVVARWGWLLASVVACGGAAAVIAYSEELVAEQSGGFLSQYLFTRYLVLLLVFALWMLAFANLSMLPVRIGLVQSDEPSSPPTVAPELAVFGSHEQTPAAVAEPSGRGTD